MVHAVSKGVEVPPKEKDTLDHGLDKRPKVDYGVIFKVCVKES